MEESRVLCQNVLPRRDVVSPEVPGQQLGLLALAMLLTLREYLTSLDAFPSACSVSSDSLIGSSPCFAVTLPDMIDYGLRRSANVVKCCSSG